MLELLISMALGIMICTATIQVFLTIKQLYLKQTSLATIQENARILTIVLGQEIETSGTLGCNGFAEDLAMVIPSNIATKEMMLPISRLQGFNYQDIQNKSNLFAQLLARILPDSEILLIKSTPTLLPVHYIDEYNQTINVKGSMNVKKGQIIVVSDCAHAFMFKAQEVEYINGLTKISIKQSIPLLLGANATIGVISSKLFYIGKTGRKNLRDKAIFALYSSDLNGRTIELVEGVEQMKVLYDGLPLEQVKNPLSVSKVQISLLLNAIEEDLSMWWHYEWLIKGHN